MMLNKRLLVLFGVAGLILLALSFWHHRTPDFYQLTVTNNSDQLVNQVSLFGEGGVEAKSIHNLEPGDQGTLTVELAKTGALRVGVLQGLNRIDQIVAKDVGIQSTFAQRLDINPNNRYIMRDEPQL